MRTRSALSHGMLAAGAALIAWSSAAAQEIAPQLQQRLDNGELAAARSDLTSILQQDPQHAQARFGLGVVQVLQAVQELAQNQHRYGAFSQYVAFVPVMRLPVPPNKQPETINHEQFRKIVADFQQRIIDAEAQLALVDVSRQAKLPLDLKRIRLDLTGDGSVSDDESFLRMFSAVHNPRGGEPPQMQVTFDAGDVPWLRGYCHFLAGFCDLLLAYDGQQLFEVCGHLVYPRIDRRDNMLPPLEVESNLRDTFFFDIIAAVHLMNLPLKEPQRMQAAHEHLLAMIRTSRQSWDLILEETDDDNEWLPNPSQTGVLQIPVSREMIEGWRGVLREMEEILEGRKLIPFWRDYVRLFGRPHPVPAMGRGINLKKVFYEPRDFDLVLTFQGTGVLPYLEQGTLSRPETWTELVGVFRGRFFGFVVWFN